MTDFTRNIFIKRKSFIDALLPYAGAFFAAWAIMWLIVMSFDGVGK